MDFNAHQSFLLTDRSFLNTVRKEIHRLAESYGLSAVMLGKVDIVVSELTSNLVKHTTNGGELLVKAVSRHGVAGIEMLCLDTGPGMADPTRMLEDGVSTVGSQGKAWVPSGGFPVSLIFILRQEAAPWFWRGYTMPPGRQGTRARRMNLKPE